MAARQASGKPVAATPQRSGDANRLRWEAMTTRIGCIMFPKLSLSDGSG